MQRILWVIILAIVFARLISLFFSEKVANGTRVRVSSRISSEPIMYERSQRIVVSNFVIFLPKFPELNYGDKVVVEGIVDGNELKDSELVDFTKNESLLLKFRNNLLTTYRRSLPQDHAALVSGMVIGSKSLLTSDFWDTLKTTGTAHVVVASGMNVTLLAGFLMNMLTSFMNRRSAIFIALICIWVYAILAGFDAPIIRAAIMGSLAFSAQKLGRLNDSQRLLVFTFAIMLIIKPEWIRDYGFILSFAATYSLMLFEAPIRKRINFVPKFFREDLSTTLAAQVFVSPIIFFSFGQFNILSPLINAIVLWTVPLITILGAVGGVLSLITYPFGYLIMFIVYPLTHWFIFIVKLFG